MRPLWFEFPEDSQAWMMEDQFMLGDDIMVAPILEKGATLRKVVFPKGEWLCLWHDERFTGPTVAEVEVPLSRMPIFVRAGCMLPT